MTMWLARYPEGVKKYISDVTLPPEVQEETKAVVIPRFREMMPKFHALRPDVVVEVYNPNAYHSLARRPIVSHAPAVVVDLKS